MPRPNNYIFEYFTADDLLVKTRRYFGKNKYFIDMREVSKEKFIEVRNELQPTTERRESLEYERDVYGAEHRHLEEYY